MTHTFRTLHSMADSADEAQASTCFSRSTGLFSHDGYADKEVKTRVSEDVADDFRRLARSLGMASVSELMREMILVRLYGKAHVVMMMDRRLSGVAGEGPVTAPAEVAHAQSGGDR